MSRKVPWIPYEQMAAIAANFLMEHNNGSEPPVNIEFLLEKAGLIIVPKENLYRKHGIDGFLSCDMRHIYVDENQYMSESYRFRFTLAHEAAHLIAHRNLLIALSVDVPENSDGGVRGLPPNEYDSLETQANMIAGMILVPESDLRQQVDRIKSVLDQLETIDEKIERATSLLYKRYRVSRDVVKIRLEKEELID